MDDQRPKPKFSIGEKVTTPSGGVPSPIENRHWATWTENGQAKGAWMYQLESRFAWYYEVQLERT